MRAIKFNNLSIFILKIISVIVVLMTAANPAISDTGQSYVDSDPPIILINNMHRQAGAWATCAAVYEISAIILQEDFPSTAHYNHNLSNGAAAAIFMTFVSELTEKDDVSPEQFKATVTYAKVAMKSLPEVKTTGIMADAETKDLNVWMEDILATVDVCKNNLDSQQSYIDMWRELATSGLLTVPD